MDFVSPPLSFAPEEYESSFFSQNNETLRLYFNQLDNSLRDALKQEYAESTAWFMG
tara:strand:+ start:67 stop:234 length:168 start_codon:yes stop_codon:yes gene_type:complete